MPVTPYPREDRGMRTFVASEPWAHEETLLQQKYRESNRGLFTLYMSLHRLLHRCTQPYTKNQNCAFLCSTLTYFSFFSFFLSPYHSASSFLSVSSSFFSVPLLFCPFLSTTISTPLSLLCFILHVQIVFLAVLAVCCIYYYIVQENWSNNQTVF